ncbi:hypothetical protein BABINDRAFT_137846 [Babjeviella inositovora NRRL Y-12698]|uniref:Uncharacterized protein n=1 Tax=Babjeviella inositovora NRRL Y-12698 TaxID=984486 RepID=A0A1E3QQK3_9ASCO|nr:uncharacterized protein BABINDRAFT_137846 [Babjeviella inositovora NRRL Y-12698]ODQ79961.1 hypothetical protein BABINDRAFT_137846 [Babjeviella inositovora NRRL Y-12698]
MNISPSCPPLDTMRYNVNYPLNEITNRPKAQIGTCCTSRPHSDPHPALWPHKEKLRLFKVKSCVPEEYSYA